MDRMKKKKREKVNDVEIMTWIDGYALFIHLPNNELLRTEKLLRADFTTMQFETQNTIYTVERLLTS